MPSPVNAENKTYIAIDLKSFYASVECAQRKLDPLMTNLVVADASRTSKTICLAVSPSLKAHGIPGRPRLFEVEQKVKEINALRLQKAIKEGKAIVTKNENGRNEYSFSGSSFDAEALDADPSLELNYIVAPPQMRKYMNVSAEVYGIYLKYIAPEDIHVYSVDEVFMDVTGYMNIYKMSAKELAMSMIREVLYTTGITATAGIGTNLYLCKIAMDIVAKHMPADKDGVRIAELDEASYRRLLWTHEPLTDFWRVGRGISKKLIAHGMMTMGDVARCSLGGPDDYYNEDLLYKLFGINAELLIDHAWGWEPCTIPEIKNYRPKDNSLSSGQVLSTPYSAEKARLVTQEMIDLLSLDLVRKGFVTDQIVLTIGYDVENLIDPERAKAYSGPVKIDHYGRMVPKHAHGTINLSYTNSTRALIAAALELYDRIINDRLLVRRITVAACHIIPESKAASEKTYEQLSLFSLMDEGSGSDGQGSRKDDAGTDYSKSRQAGTGTYAPGSRQAGAGTYPAGSPGSSLKPGDPSAQQAESAVSEPGRPENFSGTSGSGSLPSGSGANGPALLSSGSGTDPAATETPKPREKRIQEAILDIKKKYGKNAILKGMNLQEGATAKDRNSQVGGHRA